MAILYVDDLKPTGLDLMSGEESFLSDLSDEQTNLTYGGATATPYFIVFIGAAALSYQVGRNHRE
ncbi:hypothetical protein NIES2119_00650 [[Phormidium ambiguum] IAM M-71]|uniref:Uncharacterized protein n=2 Tax=[Phormidium ambiguum] IAM M-71 TaxID=454136 RepID=A0A1U7ITK7_9CYAN|nr:hypothetical protein NIES2119_00650 [Phormidium ambiguum IAM M-71]